MHRRLGPTVAFLAALAFGLLAAQALNARDGSAAGGAALRIEGDAGALELHVQQATLANVLTALGRFNIRYRASGTLNETIDGVYTGSLGHVLSRVLAGYDYVIKQDSAKFEVIVVGRRGGQAVAAPIIIPIRRRPSD